MISWELQNLIELKVIFRVPLHCKRTMTFMFGTITRKNDLCLTSFEQCLTDFLGNHLECALHKVGDAIHANVVVIWDGLKI